MTEAYNIEDMQQAQMDAMNVYGYDQPIVQSPYDQQQYNYAPQASQNYSDEEIMQALNNNYQPSPQNNVEPLYSDEEIMQALQQPQPLQGSISHTEFAQQHPILEGLADVAEGSLPIFGGIAGSFVSPFVGTGAGAGTGEIWKRNIETLRGERPATQEQALKNIGASVGEGILAGTGEKALQLLGKGLTPAKALLAKGVEKASPLVSKILSAIPEEETIRYMDIVKNRPNKLIGNLTQSIEGIGNTYRDFKSTIPQIENKVNQGFYKIADNAKSLLENQKTKLGELSGFYQKQLEDANIFINADEILNTFKTKLTPKVFGGVSRIPDRDLKIISQMSSELDDIININKPKNKLIGYAYDAKPIHIAQLNNFKTKWQTQLKELWQQGRIGSEGEGLISSLLGDIREKIYQKAPNKQLFEANEEFSNFLDDVYNPLSRKMSSQGRHTFIKDLDLKDEASRTAFEYVDNLSQGQLSTERNKLLQELKSNKELGKLITNADIKNPLNILNKPEIEIEQISKVNPQLIDELLDLKARATFERPLAINRSPFITNRVEQEQTIQQTNLLKQLLGLSAGAGAGGAFGGALGLAGVTAAQSPAIQSALLRKILTEGTSNVPKGIGAGTTTLLDQLLRGQ